MRAESLPESLESRAISFLDWLIQGLGPQGFSHLLLAATAVLMLYAAWRFAHKILGVGRRTKAADGAAPPPRRPKAGLAQWVFWRTVDSGVSRESTAVERIHTRTTNLLACILAFISLTWSVIGVIVSAPILILFANGLCFIRYLFILRLNQQQEFDKAKFNLLITLSLQYSLLTLMIPARAGLEMYLIGFAIIPLLLFSRREVGNLLMGYMFFGVVTAFALLSPTWIADIGGPWGVWTETGLIVGFYSTLLLTAGGVAVGFFYYVDHSLRIEKELDRKLEAHRGGQHIMLPQPIFDRTRRSGGEADGPIEAGVMIVYLRGLGSRTALAPIHHIDMLEHVYSRLDTVLESFDLEHLKTFGNIYILGSGVKRASDMRLANLADAALKIESLLDDTSLLMNYDLDWRVGICCGRTLDFADQRRDNYVYLWGETDKLARPLEEEGAKGRTILTQTAYDKLNGQYECEAGPSVTLSDGETVTSYRLKSRRPVMPPIPQAAQQGAAANVHLLRGGLHGHRGQDDEPPQPRATGTEPGGRTPPSSY